jgi:hypothetical protein
VSIQREHPGEFKRSKLGEFQGLEPQFLLVQLPPEADVNRERF